MRRARRVAAVLVLAGALAGVTGSASSVDPIERLGRKAAARVGEAGAGSGALSRTAAGVLHTLSRPDDGAAPSRAGEADRG
ncbi:hypothetical protein ACFUJR_04330 [Streptomyces sp. NPDC057271]|uniref:hypothetical protein n=1 Tax=unclassified Streptomyces TaxID=2593676 RepID=UPI0036336718